MIIIFLYAILIGVIIGGIQSAIFFQINYFYNKSGGEINHAIIKSGLFNLVPLLLYFIYLFPDRYEDSEGMFFLMLFIITMMTSMTVGLFTGLYIEGKNEENIDSNSTS